MPASVYPDAKKLQPVPLLLSILITLSIGISASLFTRPEIKGWYQLLHKPAFTPPPWLFGPVWTMLYIMMAVAAYQFWKRRDESAVYHCGKASYFIQLLLNFLWSLTFFKLHETGLALAVIVCLFLSIIGNMYYFVKLYKPSFALLLPYLLWVGFAAALNVSIVVLNA